MCYHLALLQTGWEILGVKYPPSFHTTSVEAPFSSALQPKLPLWKYLMAHNGKTLFITVQPSGMKVQNSVMLKHKESAYSTYTQPFHPEINKGCYVFLYLRVCSNGTNMFTYICRISLRELSFSLGALFASSGELGGYMLPRISK